MVHCIVLSSQFRTVLLRVAPPNSLEWKLKVSQGAGCCCLGQSFFVVLHVRAIQQQTEISGPNQFSALYKRSQCLKYRGKALFGLKSKESGLSHFLKFPCKLRALRM